MGSSAFLLPASLLALLTLTVAGCGQKGPLQRPGASSFSTGTVLSEPADRNGIRASGAETILHEGSDPGSYALLRDKPATVIFERH